MAIGQLSSRNSSTTEVADGLHLIARDVLASLNTAHMRQDSSIGELGHGLGKGGGTCMVYCL